MNDLGRFLDEWLAANPRGVQSDFARKVGASGATVSAWKSGQSQPSFESCLRIALFFQDDKAIAGDPLKVFAMAGRPDYVELYKEFFPADFPKKRPKSCVCDDNQDLHLMLKEILRSKWAWAIVSNLQAIHSKRNEEPPGGPGHGPFPGRKASTRK